MIDLDLGGVGHTGVIVYGDDRAVFDGLTCSGNDVDAEGYHAACASLHILEGPGDGLGVGVVHAAFIRAAGNIGSTCGDDIAYDHICGSAGVIVPADAVYQHLRHFHTAGDGLTLGVDYLLALGRIGNGVGLIREAIVQSDLCGIIDVCHIVLTAECFLSNGDLEGHLCVSACGDLGEVPGDGSCSGVVDAAVIGAVRDICGTHRNGIGDPSIGSGITAIDHLHTVGQGITNHNYLAVSICDGGAACLGDVHRLGVCGADGQLTVVTQQHGVVRVVLTFGAVGVRHDNSCAGVVGALRNIFRIHRQRRSLVSALGDVPAACAVLDSVGAGGDVYQDISGLLHGGMGIAGGSGSGPVIVLSCVVVLAYRLVVAVIERIGIAILGVQRSILGVGVEGVIHCGIKGGVGHSAVMLVFTLVAIPVVGVEMVGAGSCVIVGVDGLTAGNGGLGQVGSILLDDLLHIERIDVAAQTHFVYHAGRICLGDGSSISGIAAGIRSLGDQHLLHAQQAGRSADHDGLIIGSIQRTLYAHHKVQELVVIILTDEIVGAADIVCANGDFGSGIAEELYGVIVRKAHPLDLYILLTGSGVGLAPPHDAVVVGAGAGIVVCLVCRGGCGL